MLRIGKVQLDSRVLLAPVAGHCDLPFRLTVRECGPWPGLAFTDLLCPHGVLRQNRQTRRLMATTDADRPLGMQLYGRDPALMGEAARWAIDSGAQTLDLNMGCPVDKVTKTFAGSMMLCIPDQAVELAERLVRTVAAHASGRVPVTAKLRLGYHDGEQTAPELARRLVQAGVRCITIHGRTAALRFKGAVDLAGIARVAEAVHDAEAGVPCIGNGDIRTPFDAARMIQATGCDGVMIARAALQAPWLVRDTHHYLEHGQLPAELTLRQRLAVVVGHFEHMLAHRQARWAMHRLKQKIGPYSRHLGPCKPMRAAIMAMRDPAELAGIVARFLSESGPAADAVPVTWADRAAIGAAPLPSAA
ncbi:MAG: tRNA dihydrouridine synthase DusB [Planctomycetes bacterium]|jgi:tRNA-dihydrouridine synthase B|nr:tRNA dihydrouridine synthase DusB [Planctomycetota bacterium]